MVTHPHVEPPPISLAQETYHGKLDKYVVKLKLRRDPKLSTSELYEFIMFLFENGEPEEFLLFVRNFNMNLIGLTQKIGRASCQPNASLG